MTQAQITAWLDQDRAHIATMIRRHGWYIEYVSSCTIKGSDEEGPPFAYTVGLTGLDHPELVILGVPPELAAAILNTLGERIRAGEALLPNIAVTFDDNAWKIVPEMVPNPGELVLGANFYYRRPAHASVPLLQLSYNDREDRFPWEPDYMAPRMQPRPGTFTA